MIDGWPPELPTSAIKITRIVDRLSQMLSNGHHPSPYDRQRHRFIPGPSMIAKPVCAGSDAVETHLMQGTSWLQSLQLLAHNSLTQRVYQLQSNRLMPARIELDRYHITRRVQR